MPHQSFSYCLDGAPGDAMLRIENQCFAHVARQSTLKKVPSFRFTKALLEEIRTCLPSFPSHSLSMGVQPSPSHQEPPPVNNNDDQSFTFGIAGYKAGGPSSSLGAYPSPHYSGGAPAPMQPSPLSRLKQTIQEAGVGPMTPLGEEVRLIWKHIISIKNKTMVSGRS